MAFRFEPVEIRQKYALRLRMFPLVAPARGLAAQEVRLEFNGIELGPAAVLSQEAVVERTVPAEMFQPRNVLRFRIARPTSPQELGLSNDPRKLGVCLLSIKMTGNAK